MRSYLTDEWANPSSSYRFGSQFKGVKEMARIEVGKWTG